MLPLELKMFWRQPARNVALFRELFTVRRQGVIYEPAFIGEPMAWGKTKPTKCFLSTRDDMPPMVAVGHYIKGQKKLAADDYRWGVAADLLADYDLGDIEVVALKRDNEYGFNNQHVKDAMNIGRAVIVLVPKIDWATSLIRWAIKRNRALLVITDLGDAVQYPDGPTDPINCDKVHYKVVNRQVDMLIADAVKHEQEVYIDWATAPGAVPTNIIPEVMVTYELPRWARSNMSGDTRYVTVNNHTWDKSGQSWFKTGFRDEPKVSIKTRRGNEYPELYQEVCTMQDSWAAQLNAEDPDMLARQELEELVEYFSTLKETIRHPRRWLRFHPEVLEKYERLGKLESMFGYVSPDINEEYTDLPEWISTSKTFDTVDGTDKTAL